MVLFGNPQYRGYCALLEHQFVLHEVQYRPKGDDRATRDHKLMRTRSAQSPVLRASELQVWNTIGTCKDTIGTYKDTYKDYFFTVAAAFLFE